METSHCVQSKLKSITSLGAMSEDAYISLVTIRGILPLHSRPHFILQDSASHSVIPEPVAPLDSQPFAPGPISANAHGVTSDWKFPISLHPFLLDMRIPSTERLSATVNGHSTLCLNISWRNWKGIGNVPNTYLLICRSSCCLLWCICPPSQNSCYTDM